MSTGNTYIGHGSSFNLMVLTVPTPINGVTDVTFGSNKIDVTDTTDMGTAGTIRVFTAGLENPGDATIKLNHKPGDTSQAALLAAKDSTIHNFKIRVFSRCKKRLRR